jgi:epoxyqueuosine reductase
VNFFERLTSTALKHEFPVSGALDLESVLTPDGEFSEHLKRFDSWIAQDFDGEMSYLKRGRERRANPRLLLAEAKSIFCVAIPYERQAPGSTEGPRYARYLRGRDYHEVLAERLEKMMTEVALHDPGLKWKVCVDTSALLERSWAALAGLGWIGKNTTLIHPRLGSYLFLGEVLINREVGKGPAPLPNYCGQCTRCLTACPTQAFVEAGSLDSRRCISYWTLEKRGTLELTNKERVAMGTWVAGCDICQETCPFNMKPAREKVAGIDPAVPYNLQSDSTQLREWSQLLSETPEQYKERVKNSSLNRVKPEQFSRNLAIAFLNAAQSMTQEELLELMPFIEARVGDQWEHTRFMIRKRQRRNDSEDGSV